MDDIRDKIRVGVQLASAKFYKKDIAKAVGCSAQTISTLLGGGKIGPELSERMVEWLKKEGFWQDVQHERPQDPLLTKDPMDAVALQLDRVIPLLRSGSDLSLEARYDILSETLRTLDKHLLPRVRKHLGYQE